MMELLVYISSALLIVISAFVIFRVIVRRDYLRIGHLSITSALLELVIWVLVFFYPFIYSSPGWEWFWSSGSKVGTVAWITGMVVLCTGFLLALGTMFWFGLRRAFGLQVNRLVMVGPYRCTRNPQVMGGCLLLIGSSIIWQSWYNLVWIVLYAVVTHLMVITEEEHLLQVYDTAYIQYCLSVPRYIGFKHKST